MSTPYTNTDNIFYNQSKSSNDDNYDNNDDNNNNNYDNNDNNNTNTIIQCRPKSHDSRLNRT